MKPLDLTRRAKQSIVGLAFCLVLSLANPLTASPCSRADNLFPGSSRHAYQELYERTFAEVKANIRAEFGDIKDIRLTLEQLTPNEVYTHEVQLVLTLTSGQDVISQDTFGLFDFADRHISASLSVEPRFRKKKLSKLMTLMFLRAHPEVESFSASLTELNRSLIIVAMVTGTEGKDLQSLSEARMTSDDLQMPFDRAFEDQLVSLERGQGVIDYRNRLIKVVLETPALRLRQSLGFHQLTSIRITISRLFIGFEIEVKKGPKTSARNINIEYRNTDNVFKTILKPDGSLQKIAID